MQDAGKTARADSSEDRTFERPSWLGRAVEVLGEGWAKVDSSGRIEDAAGSLFKLLDFPQSYARTGVRLREAIRALRSDDGFDWPPRMSASGWRWHAVRQDGQKIVIEAHALAGKVWLVRVRRAESESAASIAGGDPDSLRHPATGLPQRALLIDRLQQAIERSQRTVTHRFAVVLISLTAVDRGAFAPVDLLRAIARQLQDAVRPADTVALLEQGIFALIIEPVRGDDATVQVAVEANLDNLRRALDGIGTEPSLSTGAAFAVGIGDGASHPSDLIALTRARLSRLQQPAAATVSEDAARTGQAEGITLTEEIDLATGQTGAIVVTAAHVPDSETILAALAARYPHDGVTNDGAAIASAAGASPEAAPGRLVVATANLPPIETLNVLQQVQQRWRADATVILELDEAAITQDPDSAIQLIDAAVRREISIGIGRFGIRQCSDALIDRLPLSRLTLDPQQTADARTSAQARVLVAATADWAHERDIQVIATAVTDDALLRLLAKLGCDGGRGYIA